MSQHLPTKPRQLHTHICLLTSCYWFVQIQASHCIGFICLRVSVLKCSVYTSSELSGSHFSTFLVLFSCFFCVCDPLFSEPSESQLWMHSINLYCISPSFLKTDLNHKRDVDTRSPLSQSQCSKVQQAQRHHQPVPWPPPPAHCAWCLVKDIVLLDALVTL